MVDVVVDYGKHFLKNFSNTLEQSVVFSGVLKKIVDFTGIPGSYIITGLTAFLLLFFLLSYGPLYVCYAVIVLYPAYQSFKCLEESVEGGGVSEKGRFWLKYWIIFALFHAAEHIADNFVWWIPGYTLIKLIYLCWCFAPLPYNGATIMYENYVQPMFLHNSETVDRVVKMIQDTFGRFMRH